MTHKIDTKVLNGYKHGVEIASSTKHQKYLTMVIEFTLHADGKLSNKTYFDVHQNGLKLQTPSINLAIEKYNSLE